MVGRVPENLRIGLREALVAIGTQDGPRLVQSFKTLGVLLPTADLKLIELASMQFFDRFGGMSIGDLRQIDENEMMSFALQFRELMLDLPFQLPENLLLLGRTVGILSGMCSGLDPQFNLWTSLAPYASQLVSEEGTPGWQTWLGEAGKVVQTLVALPGRADRVLTLVERGELNVQTPRLDMRVRRVDRSVRGLTRRNRVRCAADRGRDPVRLRSPARQDPDGRVRGAAAVADVRAPRRPRRAVASASRRTRRTRCERGPAATPGAPRTSSANGSRAVPRGGGAYLMTRNSTTAPITKSTASAMAAVRTENGGGVGVLPDSRSTIPSRMMLAPTPSMGGSSPRMELPVVCPNSSEWCSRDGSPTCPPIADASRPL